MWLNSDSVEHGDLAADGSVVTLLLAVTTLSLSSHHVITVECGDDWWNRSFAVFLRDKITESGSNSVTSFSADFSEQYV